MITLTTCRQKFSRLIVFIGRLRHVINESSLNTIYTNFILPQVDYGDVWQSTSKSSLFSLQKLQNRAGRIIRKVNFPMYLINTFMKN